jgi:hypothetical protein
MMPNSRRSDVPWRAKVIDHREGTPELQATPDENGTHRAQSQNSRASTDQLLLGIIRPPLRGRPMKYLIAWILTVGLIVQGASAFAAEKEKGPLSPGDWLAKDRAVWMDLSGSKPAAVLKDWYVAKGQKNTFIQAAVVNTQAGESGEYAKVHERQAYYDWVSLAVEADPLLSKGLGDVRFFHATAMVTSRGFLGWVETPLSKSGLPTVTVSQPTRDVVNDINKRLFKANVDVLSYVLYKWNEPRSPSNNNATAKISALEFDMQMVELEQGLVESVITTKGVSKEAIDGLNGVLKTAITVNGGMRRANAMAEAAGIKTPDFRNIAWRKAIGRALVYDFHGKSVNEYVSMMRAPANAVNDEAKKEKRLKPVSAP